MRGFYTIFFCLGLLVFRGQVPDWAWARTEGSDDLDEATSIACDASGNVFMTGYFSGALMTVGTVSLTNGTPGSKQFFIVKYSRTGSVLWAKSAGGNDDDEGVSLAVDGSGNAYVCGNYESPTITFGSSVLTNSSNPGQGDMFLVKYSSSGTVLWAHTFGGGLQEEANAVACDASGNVCLTGNYFSLSVLFGSYGVINTGVSDAFVAKFNSSGVSQWAKRIGGGQTDNGNDVGIDSNGNVYVTGDYDSNTITTFSPALSNSGGFDVYIAKYDASGNVVFASRFGGSGDENSTALHAQGTGNFFICGYFESNSLVFGSTTITNGGSRSMFLVKYNTGGAPQWAQKAAGSQNSIPRQLAEDASSLYMAGAFDLASVSFGSTTLTKGGSLDAFLVKYNIANGSVDWAKNSGETPLDQANAVAVGGGFVHIAGMYTETLTLRDNVLNSAGATDAFISKLCFAPAGPLSAAGTTACAGYPVSLNATTPAGTEPVWFAAVSGGSSLYVGSPYNAVAGGTFYVASRDTNAGCGMYSNSRLPASATVHPPVNPVVTVTGHTLIAAGNGSVVAWYDCNKTSTITGQTGSSYVLAGSGYFAAIMVSSQGCRDTSSCNNYSYNPGSDTVIVTPGLAEREGTGVALSVYPNPAPGYFFVKSRVNTTVAVVDALGKTVQRFTLDGDNERGQRVGPLTPGVYFVIPGERSRLLKVIVTN